MSRLARYSVHIVSNGVDYNVTQALTDLTLSEPDGQLAQTAKIEITNIKHNGTYLTSIFDVIDEVYIYATFDGTTDEVFRGYVWESDYLSSAKKTFTLPCYDNLIYLQKSEICKYFSAGATSQKICQDICDDWGIELNYTYDDITHPKLPLEGSISDCLINDVLEEVKKKNGYKYVIRSSKGVLNIAMVGENKKIYEINAKQNVGSVRHLKTMEDVVTKVIITGKKDDNDRTPIEATVSQNTDKYGTIQKRQSKDEDTSISDAKKEANEILDEKSTPKVRIYLNDVVDVPFVRKGDKVKVTAGDIVGKYCIVLDIAHHVKKKTMDLMCEFAE